MASDMKTTVNNLAFKYVEVDESLIYLDANSRLQF
jgi:hypothetical protein